jgi:hypothetical protein
MTHDALVRAKEKGFCKGGEEAFDSASVRTTLVLGPGPQLHHSAEGCDEDTGV